MVDVVDIRAGAAEQPVLVFALSCHPATKDSLDSVGGVDVAVTGILVSVILVIFLITLPLNVLRLAVVVLGFFTRVDVFEDAAILHGMISFGVDLAWTL